MNFIQNISSIFHMNVYMYVYMHLLVFEILTTFAFLQYFYSCNSYYISKCIQSLASM